MNRPRLSAPIAWALLLLLLVVAYTGAAQPLMALYQEREEFIDSRQRVVERQSAIIARGPLLDMRRATAEADLAAAPSPIPAGTASPTTHLQALVQRVAEAHGLTVNALQPLADRPHPPFQSVSVRASVSGPIAGAQRLLHTLETGAPAMRISALNIAGGRGSQPLDLSFDVSALAEASGAGD